MNTTQNDGTEDLSRQFVDHYPVIIIGGGHAGLSISRCCKERGIDHIVFEKDRLAESWRSKRWDSFCLVTPNGNASCLVSIIPATIRTAS